jgi:putative hydrolase of the HAD superfamily
MYRAVFFDAFNTLFSLRNHVGESTKRLPMHKGRVNVLLHRFDARLQAAYGRIRSDAEDEAAPLPRFLAALADLTGLSTTGPFALLLRTDWLIRHWFRVYADVLGTLQELQQACTLGVISNAWPQMERFLELLGISHFFDSVTISAQVGLSKPDPAIFELALRNLRIKAEQAIFVDDMPYNVVAAEGMGLRALWLVRGPGQAIEVPDEYRGLTQIHSLRQVVGLAKASN